MTLSRARGRLFAALAPVVFAATVNATEDETVGEMRFQRSLALEDAAFTSANLAIGDLNGDGHLDALLVKGRHWPLQNLVRFGDGAGHFSEAKPVGPGPDRSYTGELVDLDADGDLDMLVSNDSPDPKRILHNDGNGLFTEVQQFGSPDWNTRHLSVADLNSDGLQDIIVANRGGKQGTESFVCFGMKGGRVSEPCEVVYRGSATTITPADLDGDGDLDLVIPHRDGGQSELRFNDGDGGFEENQSFGAESVGFRSSVVADFDGDGWVDIAVIAPGSRTGIASAGPDGGSGVIASPRSGIFFATSPGRFGPMQQLTEALDRPYAIHAADVDADGRMDLIVGHVNARPIIWFNKGSRHFSPVAFGDAEGASYGFAVEDLNGDALLDIAVARSGAVNTVYFGAQQPQASK